LLIKEKLKKEREALAFFIFNKCISFSEHYTYNKILSNVNYIFQQKTISKGEQLCKEGQESDRIFIIKSGMVSLYRRISRQNYFD
jgi:hypothetical protein